MSAPNIADDVELEVGHVHAEIVLYDPRNAIDRVLEALRRRGLVDQVRLTAKGLFTVSYTHLTLPTNREV